MSETLALWHEDHVNFARLLHILEDELALFHEGGSPDYALMLDIMYYMTQYPDVVHHPKEDLVFAKIKERDITAAAAIDTLTRQHVFLKACGEQLVHDLDDIVNGSIIARSAVGASARDYLANFREHMRVEERDILPLAARLLQLNDWSAIDAAIRRIEDPLFGPRTDERYACIAEHIGRHAAHHP